MSALPIIIQKKKLLGSKLNQNEMEVTAYIAGLATPLSATEITLLNTLAVSLKTGLGVTDLGDFFDYLNIRAGETAEQSLRNFAKRANDSTAVNSPTFTAGEGFTGNGTSSYIELDFIPSNGVNFTLNDASYGLYLRTFDRGINKYLGVYSTTVDGGTSNSLVIGSTNVLSLSLAINGNQISISDSIDKGLIILNRLESTGYNSFFNKSKLSSISSNSTKRPNQKIVELARRGVDTTIGLFNTSQVAFSFCAKGLTDAHVAVIVDAFEAYLDAKGKGIIA